ncbi:GNAT family N-acetyltransferase [Clostridium senegalense]|uniref:GNAT family N-acetyltransferase n=1 Tax=Clostridium senegalense TaxID=1465809 RepID=UPI001C11CF7F|nr:GNAT family N-acetyltransferase [Clostridium senegalense]MBU5228026.1 GNAT family N-acetyltransferase [Clostridium senegalense]
MIKLIEANEKYLKSYIEAYDEYEDNHVTTYAFNDARSYDIFVKYDNYKNERNLKPNRVGASYFWLVDDEKDLFIGEISIRHNLTDALLQYGGHIGYGIRYSEWNKGYGTFMLKLALEKAKEMDISRILITCDDDNYASAKIMENNDMVLQDKVENLIDGQKILTRRYWKTL